MGFFHQQSDISDISKQSSIALNSTMIPNQSLKMAEYLLCRFLKENYYHKLHPSLTVSKTKFNQK